MEIIDFNYALAAAAAGKVVKSDGDGWVSADLLSESGEIAALDEKTAPVAADVILGEDSEDSDAKVAIALASLGGLIGAQKATDATSKAGTAGGWQTIVSQSFYAPTGKALILVRARVSVAGVSGIGLGYRIDEGSWVAVTFDALGAAGYQYHSGFDLVTGLDDTEHTVDFAFIPMDQNGSADGDWIPSTLIVVS